MIVPASGLMRPAHHLHQGRLAASVAPMNPIGLLSENIGKVPQQRPSVISFGDVIQLDRGFSHPGIDRTHLHLAVALRRL